MTNSFGSPAIWKRVGKYCLENDVHLPSIKRILMASAPVPPSLVADFVTRILDGGEVSTPFGASEAVPITMMSGSEIVAETAALSDQGQGMCVGREIRGHTIRVIRITDDPIPEWDDACVRLLEGTARGPLFVATPTPTTLDALAEKHYRAAPEDLARLGMAVAHALDAQSPEVSDLSDDERALVSRIADALKAAERPVVVAGFIYRDV